MTMFIGFASYGEAVENWMGGELDIQERLEKVNAESMKSIVSQCLHLIFNNKSRKQPHSRMGVACGADLMQLYFWKPKLLQFDKTGFPVLNDGCKALDYFMIWATFDNYGLIPDDPAPKRGEASMKTPNPYDLIMHLDGDP